jgi:hypothetical protein
MGNTALNDETSIAGRSQKKEAMNTFARLPPTFPPCVA